MPGFFSGYFALPQLELPARSDENIMYADRIQSRGGHPLVLGCPAFLADLTNSHELHTQISYIRNMNSRTRRLLKDTVLVSELFVAYSHLVSVADRFFKHGKYDNGNLRGLQFGCKILASHLDS